MESNLEFFLYCNLERRYSEMAKGTASEKRVCDMMDAVVDNCKTWPKDKTGRWVGYVQCLLIEVEKVTTVKAERDYTRPLFHEHPQFRFPIDTWQSTCLTLIEFLVAIANDSL